jgi:hypothetical protein
MRKVSAVDSGLVLIRSPSQFHSEETEREIKKGSGEGGERRKLVWAPTWLWLGTSGERVIKRK